MAKHIIDFKATEFIKTGTVGAQLNRLNWRTEILLSRNLNSIKGKRVLDLASHDGRFSYASLKLGAKHVTGIEARANLVKNSNKNLTDLGYNSKEFKFIKKDIFDYLPHVKPKEFDTILCFGFFYHTIRQIELLREINRILPQTLILDTRIAREIPLKKDLDKKAIDNTLNSFNGSLQFKYEKINQKGSTIDPINIVAYPTKSFINLILNQYGFGLKEIKWDEQEINDWSNIKDYKNGNRSTYIATLKNI